MLWYGFVPGWQLLALPIFLLLAFGLALGVGLLLAALNVEYRDFRFIVPFILQLGLFVSPIAFSTTDVPPQWRTLLALNPLVGIIEGFRWSLLGGRVPLSADVVLVSAATAAAMIVLGIWYFRRMEHNFADVI
jgi:lipopolysaccharide transport system permease protein